METRALIYVRRSMVRYKQDRASPERQLANCVAACEEKAGDNWGSPFGR